MTARAELRQVPGGSVGVVDMHGNGCSLVVDGGPSQLLDGDGHPLAVPLGVDGVGVNPPQNIRPDLSLAGGAATWGFAWWGSWCGPPATAVVLALRDPANSVPHPRSYGRLVVPLTGPAPRCQGPTSSTLVAGVAGGGDQGVLPVPPDYRALRLRLSATSAHDGVVRGLVLSISNSSNSPVVFSPCVEYAIQVADTTQFGTDIGSSSGTLPCDRTVSAHGRIKVDLPSQQYAEGAPPGQEPRAGTAIEVTVAIAGVPSATATTHVR